MIKCAENYEFNWLSWDKHYIYFTLLQRYILMLLATYVEWELEKSSLVVKSHATGNVTHLHILM